MHKRKETAPAVTLAMAAQHVADKLRDELSTAAADYAARVADANKAASEELARLYAFRA